jgi:hypothetical protein
LLEALEICWAGTTQRRPSDVEAAEYARHLAHEGDGDFEIAVDDEVTDVIAEHPMAELVRCVLAQDTIGKLVEEPPQGKGMASFCPSRAWSCRRSTAERKI